MVMFDISCGLLTRDPTLEGFESYRQQASKNVKSLARQDSGDLNGPDLYTEADEMVESLVMLSSLAELRKCLRRPRCDTPLDDRIAHLPISHAEVMNSLTKNQNKLPRRRFGCCENPLAMTKARPRVTGTTILHVVVNNRTRFNFSLSINHKRKRVVVCFEDCVLDLDHWETRLMKVSNPYQSDDLSCPEHIHIHEGFLPFLGSSSNPWSEFGRLLLEHILPALEQNKGYRLFATGFKNGAALATLFAVYAASKFGRDYLTPVYLFSFGSPYVGDQAFRELHQHLEKLAMLRHLRVTNSMDYSPLTPQMSLRFDLFKPMFFKHVGIQLKLYDDLFPPQVSYPRTDDGLLGNAINELQRGWEQSIIASLPLNPLEWPDHGLKHYVDRLLVNKALLQGLHLEQLYGRKNLVGKQY